MIRPYQSQDTDALIAIWEKANALAHPFLTKAFVAQVASDMRTLYLPNAEIWIADKDGAAIGFIALLGNEIGGLFVNPAYIGKGYGRALVDHAFALKGTLRVEVFKDNAVARPFYERYGFIYVEEYLHEPSGALTCKMAMPAS